MDFDILQTFLIERGYSIGVRRAGWVSLLIRRGEERWVGDGDDEADALAAAVLKMFPSRASWELLGEALAEAHALVGLADVPAPGEPSRDEPALAPPAGQEDEAAPAVGDEPAAAALGAPADAVDVIGPADDGEPDEPFDRVTTEAEPDPAAEPLSDLPAVGESTAVPALPMAARTAVRAPESPEQPRLSVREALEDVATLSETIDALLPEVAWMAPLHVRLQLTAWIARGRHLQEETLHADEVQAAVHRLAKRLDGVSKRWWPGSVTALQRDTTPEQAARGLNLALPSGSTWDEVADAIEVLGEDEEDGWADGRALEPRPAGVEAAFQRIVSNMEDLLGPLAVEANGSVLAYLSGPATGDLLKDWAQRLRWMRGVAPSGEQWARAMGRLRWAAQKSSAARQHLEAPLDPATVPREGTWAKALGEDPQRRIRQRALRAVVRDTPDETAPPAEVAAWLARALLLGADLNYRQVAGLLATHHGVILGMTSEDLGGAERNVRSRLRKLQRALRDGDAPAPPPEVAEADDVDGLDADSADPVGDLIEAVRARINGTTAVFVSNRTDKGLQAKLEQRLGLTIDWCDGSSRRMQSVAKQVRAGSYGLVILATGFAGHDADATLGKAASLAGVPFVRAYKGRPLATVRAIARDLGIRNEGE